MGGTFIDAVPVGLRDRRRTTFTRDVLMRHGQIADAAYDQDTKD
jgi:hypothetical protein